MLGKGLESLIPPNQGIPQNNSGSDNSTGTQDALQANKSFTDKPSNPAALHFQGADKDGQEGKVGRKKTDGQAGQAHSASSGQAVFQIEVEKIKPNPQQPRRDFEEEPLKELAASIREVGILQPLVVTKVEKETPTGTDVEYILIAGERRLMAAKLLGLERVPAIVKRVDFERERLTMAIVENIQREDLNPIETARAFSRLQDEFNLTQREIATRLGKSREAVANSVRLLDLPAYIQDALAKGQITETHGRLLLAVTDQGAQKKLFDDIVLNRMTTRELKERVKPQKKEDEVHVQIDLPPELRMLQEQLSSKLGAPVKIEQKGDSGRIMINFYSDEELRGIIDKLGSD